ncbi:unnamed protein product [marine sediment metagenome]|uniref:Uncharacterized protein n=1 Tax=marine sediment metagenome TaxID=412755 RepID=X1B0M0_9ZZZZ
MIQKIGMVMVGFAALVLLVISSFIIVYEKELTQWRETPPEWVWLIMFWLVAVGMVGCVMSLLGE